MDFYDVYAERIRISGSGSGSAKEQKIIDNLDRDFENSPSFNLVCIIEPDGTSESKRIQTTKSSENNDTIYIHPKETMISGSIITSLQDYSWIVTKIAKVGNVFQEAYLQRVNTTFKWMNGINIVTTKAVIGTLSQNDGVLDTAFLSVPEVMITIIVQKNSDTVNIKRDKRLLIGGVPYKVTKTYDFTYENCLFITATEDLPQADDINDVCDYVTNAVSEDLILIIGSETIYKGGKKRYVLQSSGTTVSAAWTFSESLSYATIVQDNDGVFVQISNLIENIGKTFTLRATYQNVIYTKLIKVVSLV